MRVFAAVLATVLVAGCGNDEGERESEPPPAGPGVEAVELELRFDGGAGQTREASVACTAGEAETTGYLADGDAAELCRAAGGVRRLLTTEPSAQRACTQIYGGPQRARITGTVAGRPVDRRLDRQNGCRIAEWDRLQRAGLLPGP